MRAAADILGIAPSSISRQINQLERDLKIDLVEKGTHKMRLTAAGSIVVEYYDSRIQEYEVLLARLAEMRNLRTNTVRIALGEGLLSSAMMSCLKAVSDLHSEVAFDLITTTSGEVQRMVLDDTAQIGLVLEYPEDVRLRVHSSIAQPIRLISRPDHPLRQISEVSPAEVAGQRLVMPGPNLRLAEILNAVFRGRGLPLNVILASNSLQIIIESVKAGMGVALLPAILVMEDLASGSLTATPIRCEELESTRVVMVTRIGRRLSHPATKLLSGMAGALQQRACSTTSPARLD